MKSYTDIEQSRKLFEILPIESADMKYPYFGDGQYGTTALFGEPIEFSGGKDIPCWSLAALLSLMPKLYDEDDPNDGGCQPVLCKGFDNNMWHVVYRATWYGTDWYCEPIDAAFDMVCWLVKNEKI